MGGRWRCKECNQVAIHGFHFGFHPFKNFPASPDCPFCSAKRSMWPDHRRAESSCSNPNRKPLKPKLKTETKFGKLTIKLSRRG